MVRWTSSALSDPSGWRRLFYWAKIYPGGKVVAAMVDGKNGRGGSVSYASADQIPRIAGFYDANLAAAGKKPGPIADTPDAAIRYVSNDERDGGGLVMISREKNLSSVTILYKGPGATP